MRVRHARHDLNEGTETMLRSAHPAAWAATMNRMLSRARHGAAAAVMALLLAATPAWAIDTPSEGLPEGHNDLYCLALNIYWEARSEPVEGQVAVAAVTLNRVESHRFPDTVCEVITQGGYARRHRCQFSWWCDGRSDDPYDPAAWQQSVALATEMLYAAAYEDPTNGALFYHATYVDPHWARQMTQQAHIGLHIFYTDDNLRF